MKGRVRNDKKEFQIHGTYEIKPKLRSLYEDFCFRPDEFIQVYINPDTLADAWDHALTGLQSRVEVGGALIGNVYRDEATEVDFVEINDIERLKSIGNGVSVDIPPEEWIRVHNLVEEHPRYRGRFSIIGWYHSHPNMRAFMSNVDSKTQANHFGMYGMVALVLGGNDLNPDIRCFDAGSREVPLYYIPEEGDINLQSAKARAIKRRARGGKLDRGKDEDLGGLIRKVDLLESEVKMLKEEVKVLGEKIQRLMDELANSRNEHETTEI